MQNPSPKILEVAMEISLPKSFLDKVSEKFGSFSARSCAMSTSVGGIGPLLRERIVEQGEAGLDVVGVSLLYESVWVQVWHEWGQLSLQKRNVGNDLRQLFTPTNLGFNLTLFSGEKIPIEVWELNYGQAKVYFLAAPLLADVVYPGPKDMPQETTINPYAWSHEIRLKQSWVIGRGALVLSKKLNRPPSLVVLSESPTLFAYHNLATDDLQNDPFFSSTKYIFNDHTPLEYAHPIWDEHTLDLIKVDPNLYRSVPAWNPLKKTLDVTSLLVGLCDGVYGVAKKHGEVMKAMPSLHSYASKINYVTNGVRSLDWQAPEFVHHQTLTNEELLKAKWERKKVLLDWVWRHCRLWPVWAEKSIRKKIIVWTRRITPYKRLDILVKMLEEEGWKKRFLDLNSVILFGGRIHQQDNHAQDIVYALLELLGKDPQLQERVVMIDNFNVWEAPLLYQGCDASMMVADDTREASATGFMKTQMNGGVIIATEDGAVPEFVRFWKKDKTLEEGQFEEDNGFLIPYVNGEPTPLGLLEALENFSHTFDDPQKRVSFMRSALARSKEADVSRTVQEVKKLYDQVLKKIPLEASS